MAEEPLPTTHLVEQQTAGSSYRDYYTADERERVKRAFEIMASRQTWRYIQRYFDDDNDNDGSKAEEHAASAVSRIR